MTKLKKLCRDPITRIVPTNYTFFVVRNNVVLLQIWGGSIGYYITIHEWRGLYYRYCTNHECGARVMSAISVIQPVVMSEEWCNIQYSRAKFVVMTLLYREWNEQTHQKKWIYVTIRPNSISWNKMASLGYVMAITIPLSLVTNPLFIIHSLFDKKNSWNIFF